MSDEIVPAEHGSDTRVAKEAVVHGMLSFLAHHTPDARRARIDATLRAITETESRGAPRAPRFFRRMIPLGIAACVLFFMIAYSVFTPENAVAQVERTIRAQRTGPDRRYDIRVLARTGESPDRAPGAQIDVRAPDLLVIGHTPPGAASLVYVGRDTEGEWAIGSDGQIVRENPGRFFPPWRLGRNVPVVDSLDRILEQIPEHFELRASHAAQIEGNGPLFTRVSATKKGPEAEFPDRIELWLNTETHELERMEMHWDSNASRPRSPAMILIRRMDLPALPADWFSAPGHAGR